MVTCDSICIFLRWQDFGEGEVGVLANKQGFKDCEQYVLLEAWLADKVHEYCDDKDNLEVVSVGFLELDCEDQRNRLLL